MPIEMVCECGKKLAFPDGSEGKKGRCKTCGAAFQIHAPLRMDEDFEHVAKDDDLSELDLSQLAMTDEEFDNTPKREMSATPPLPEPPRVKQYKILTQKDKWFSGKFDPEKLEEAINAYAKQGWTVRSIATASIPGITGVREEMIVLLER